MGRGPSRLPSTFNPRSSEKPRAFRGNLLNCHLGNPEIVLILHKGIYGYRR